MAGALMDTEGSLFLERRPYDYVVVNEDKHKHIKHDIAVKNERTISMLAGCPKCHCNKKMCSV